MDLANVGYNKRTMATQTNMFSKLTQNTLEYVKQYNSYGELVTTSIPNLAVFSRDDKTVFEAILYQPAFCLILQGQKETVIGERTIRYSEGDALVVSHDLPVVSRVIKASKTHPYLALVFHLDLGQLRSMQDEIATSDTTEADATSVFVCKADELLVDALHRYFSLVDKPVEAKVLAPLIEKEILFRLLMAPYGAMLRNMLKRDSNASRINHAIGIIRQQYRSTLVVPDVAQAVGMSTSSFHEHFKTVTQNTPLQYQKDLRLMEAKRLLMEGKHSVSSTAFEVGYESPSQFSRDYSRKFGVSPQADANNEKQSQFIPP